MISTMDADAAERMASGQNIRVREERGGVAQGVIVHLSNVVAADGECSITEEGKFRCYGGCVRTTTMVGDKPSTTVSPTVYRIGRRSDSIFTGLDHLRESGIRLEQRFALNQAYATELGCLNRRYTSLTGRFDNADFSAMVERLSAGLCQYALTGTLTWRQLMGGAHLNIRSLTTFDDPVAATPYTVFIPRTAALQEANATFSALVASANGSGSLVATDIVVVDTETNAPRLNTYDGAELAAGCLQGIRILCSIMSKSDAGAVAAYAFFKGLHGVATVVGHTDEGGYMREVLRNGRFAAPHGGVYVGDYRTFTGLPVPAIGALGSYEALVDGALLHSAAAVAVCDPTVTYKGQVFPTLSVTRGDDYTRGNDNVGTDADSRYHAKNIAGDCGDFSSRYVSELARILGMNDGGAEEASAHLQASFSIAAQSDRVSRHLKYKVVAPFYWIEPTTLYKERMPGTNAGLSGFGPLAGTLEPGSMSYFEDVNVIRGGSEKSICVVKYRTARTCGAIVHHQLNISDGLAAIVPRQADFTGFALRGGADEGVDVTFNKGAGLDAYVWQRGDAGLPAPAELLYTGGTIGVFLKHGGFNDNLEYVEGGIKGPHELTGSVSIRATPPSKLGLMGIGDRPRHVRRSRTVAAAALQTVRSMKYCGPETGGDIFPVANCAPPMFSPETSADASLATAEVVPRASGTGTARQGAPAARVTVMEPMRPRPQTGSSRAQSSTVRHGDLGTDGDTSTQTGEAPPASAHDRSALDSVPEAT